MGVNVTYNPQDLTTSNLRLFQIAVPLNRYDEVMFNVFRFMTRLGVEDLSLLDAEAIGSSPVQERKMLTDIHWTALTPTEEELSRLRVKNVRFAVDFTDKLLIRDIQSGLWKGTLYFDPNFSDDPIIAFDPLFWRPETNFGRYYELSNNRGVLAVYQEDDRQDLINVGILTIPLFRCWAFEVLSYVSYGNYVYTDICDELKLNWVLQDINLSMQNS